MDAMEKYKKAFCAGLGIDEKIVEGLEYQAIQEWDSVGHMMLISEIEDAFGIVMDADDIIDFSSFEKGMDILKSNYNISFES